MRSTGYGLAAIGFYAAHAAHYLWRRQPENLLWVCHLGALAVGVGWLLGWPTWNAVGTFWLTLGFPLWIVDLATGGEFIPTSILTHGGGLVLGVLGLRKLGLPSGAWWKGAVPLALLHLVCRWATPAASNVNLAHAIHPGWESFFPSHFVYLLSLLGLYTLIAASLQVGLRRSGFAPKGPR